MKKVHGVPFRIELHGTGGDWSLADDQMKVLTFQETEAEVWEDGSDVLERFLAVRTAPQVLAFLNRLGCFYSDPNEGAQPELASIADFFEWQTIVKKLMVEPPTSWGFLTKNPVEPVELVFKDDHPLIEAKFGGVLATLDFLKAHAIANSFRFPLNFVWHSNGQHYLRIETTDILQAIMATVCLGHISRTIHKFCQRPDCGAHFVAETKHRRKYCNTKNCGHVMAMRMSRARAAKKKKLAKAQKKTGAKK